MHGNEPRIKKSAYVGVEGLFCLWKEALSMYKTAVNEYGMSYERFREDFINSRSFLCEQDRDIMNDHQVNLGRIASFLSVRKDLVRKFSSREADLSAFHTCMREFMLGSLRSEAKADIVNFECFLSDRTLSIIADAANDIPLFRQRVSSDDMGRLFNECTSIEGGPLVANQNTTLAYFFSQLNYSGVISARYQHVIASNKLIKSSRGMNYMTQADLASALSRFYSADRPLKMRIDKWIILIKSAFVNQ